jgi:RNA polymerase sigma factor (sigma-70 family)
MRMEDPEVVAAIVAGDPDGLAEAYDRYAVPLYAYCCSMLREPADAADAVQDTFLIAAAKLRGLRDPAKLRAWLYAVARNECLRRLRAAKGSAALADAPDAPASSAGPEAETERADLHELVRDAIDGLNPGEREIIELSLGHDLEGDDLADALGVSRNHAHALLSRARSQLERSLGALIVARTGREACAELDAMLAGWDGQLTALMRKRISRHIEQCGICGESKRRELTPALFAGVLPLVAVMPGFRDQLLKMMADRTPAGLGHRLGVANRAGPFGPSGFPKPITPPWSAPWHAAPWHVARRHIHGAVAIGAAAVVVAGAIAAVVIGGGLPHGQTSAAGPNGGTHTAAGSSGGQSPAHDGPSAHGRNGPGPSASGGATAPSLSGTSGTPGSGSSTGGSGSSTSGSSPSATSTAPSGSSTATAVATATPAQGTLTVSTGALDLVSVNGTASAKFTITASGGPVSNYSITVGSALAGELTVSPAAGSLASGGSVTVTVTTTTLVALAGELTVNPGGQTITVLVSLGL